MAALLHPVKAKQSKCGPVPNAQPNGAPCDFRNPGQGKWAAYRWTSPAIDPGERDKLSRGYKRNIEHAPALLEQML
ncbi:MAG: hypothetical protein E5W81_20630 [Mesorhizobium sp.]|uniref:hypothetical protein n=1 Tax=unclassified Mesorhizobium TaxID=325217 RepID=UPI0011F990C3|nr:hypothetical protein [Mesorhizobium sp.]TIT22727.1 MAG: hypothetical protein E5W70_11295 [Mesorhizobium sp.]TIX38251.1 MAG: hypothetical protein E5V36_22125 [Mesorhizobium sp.]TKB62647.1 MAG: hypothetical protein E5W81_20630 [Mesorhizobium sp.]